MEMDNPFGDLNMKTPNDMSDKKKEILNESTKNTIIINEDSPLQKSVLNAMQSYADQHLKDVLEEEESKIKLMPEYQVLQNPTDYDYRDVENARKIVNTTKWLLNHLKQRKG